ncbi:MAG TPA: hypothetical protein VIH59_23490 [Candidatus Tectomicrobia bacterium]
MIQDRKRFTASKVEIVTEKSPENPQKIHRKSPSFENAEMV